MRVTSKLASLALAIGLVLPLGHTAATAQVSDDDPWVKVCGTDPGTNKSSCFISQDLFSDRGQLLARVTIREFEGEARRSLLLLVPVQMLLRANVRVQIDGGRETEVPYSICFPNACFAELAIDTGFIDRMKAGGAMQLTTLNQQGKPVRFDFTLIGFTKSYTGPGVDPNAVANRQEELQRELEAKAQAARDRLVAAQRRAVENQ